MNSVNVPQLRFPGFEGEWEEKKLGQIAKITTGSTPSTHIEEYYNGEKLFVSPADIQENRYVFKTKTTLSNIGFSKGRKVAKGSVLFVCIGSTIGKVGQATEECLTNQQINSLYAENEYDNGFIYEILEKNGTKIKLLAGVQAVPQINKTDFSNFKYFFPTLPEQQKIASFLSAVDEKIQQLSRKKELLEQYKKGVMQQLFSGKLRFKEENGKDYPDWEEKKLGEVLKIGSGKDYKHLDAGNIPVFGTGGYMLSVNKFLHSGETVFIGRKGTIDKPFYFEGDFWTVDTLFYTHTFKNTIPKFIYCVFQQIDWKLHNEASGVPSLSKSTIEKLKFDFPCIEEQQKIANFLSSIDAKIENTKDELGKIQLFKKGLLQQLFV